MKKWKYLLILYLFNLNAQSIKNDNLVVEYDKVYDKNGLAYTYSGFLISNDSESIFFEYGRENQNLSLNEVINQKFSPQNISSIVIRNNTDQLLFLGHKAPPKKVLVKDDFLPIQWGLHKDKKEILGYQCKKATCTFRGRNYTAWYAPDLPYNAGPWKFSGLPGLILEVEDEANYYNYYSKRIYLNKTLVDMQIKFPV